MSCGVGQYGDGKAKSQGCYYAPARVDLEAVIDVLEGCCCIIGCNQWLPRKIAVAANSGGESSGSTLKNMKGRMSDLCIVAR